MSPITSILALTGLTTLLAMSAQDAAGFKNLAARAENGDPAAQVALAIHYRDGKGVAKDHALAMQWAHRAADRGDSAAMAYLSGEGVEPDPVRARRLAERAAELNDPSGLVVLGEMRFQAGELDAPTTAEHSPRACSPGRPSSWLSRDDQSRPKLNATDSLTMAMGQRRKTGIPGLPRCIGF
jgi:TPR repeat protein